MCKRIFANQTSEQGDVPFFKIGTIGGTPDAYITRDLFEEYKAKYNYPHEGEVMITCAGTVGKTIVFDGEDAYFQDSNIVWLSNPKQLYINSFLNYVLSRVNWNILNSTTITRIYNDNLRELVINYPSIKEQEKIVALLSLLDRRIAIQNKVIEKYESLIKALCHHLFSVGRDDVIKISDLGEYFPTMNLSKSDLSIGGEECVLYGELFTTYGRVITEIKSGTKTTDGAVRSNKNDLLFPASTTVDALSLISPAAITKEGVILGGDMFGIRIRPNLDNRYLSYLLYYCYRERFAGYAQGSTIIHLHYNDIKNIEIRIHDNATQKRIAQLLSVLETMKANQEKISSYYSTQKAFLLKKLFI